MKNAKQDNRKNLVTAGIWSMAVLAVVAVGMMTLFSTASRRTRVQNEDTGAVSETVTIETVTDAILEETPETEEAGFFKPANPIDTEIVTDSAEAENSADEEETKSAMEEIDEEDAEVPAAIYPTGEGFSCIMPVNGSVIKEFTDDVAVYSLTMNDWRVHSGVDIYAPVGTNVAACANGTVERVWEDPFLGQCIEINHGGNIKSLYANLSTDLPKNMEAGVTVLAGDIIGGVGESMIIEMADSDHLHFAVSVDGLYVDPLDYMTNYQGTADTSYET